MMNIKQALLYPYRKENWVSSLAVPSIYVIGLSIVIAIASFTILMPATANMKSMRLAHTPMSPAAIWATILPGIGSLIGMFVLVYVASFPLMGYWWALIDAWQTNGYDSPPPRWSGHWKTYFIDGFHFFLSLIVLIIPIFLGLITLGLLMPFAYAPLFLCARQKRIGAVIRQLPQAMQLAANHYGAVFGTLWLAVLIGLIALIPYYILSLTVVGGIVFLHAIYVAVFHLLTQAYGISNQTELPQTGGNVTSPSAWPSSGWNK